MLDAWENIAAALGVAVDDPVYVTFQQLRVFTREAYRTYAVKHTYTG